MCHIYWFAYVEPSLHPGINPTWSWWMISLTCCWVWFASILSVCHLCFLGILICTFLTVPSSDFDIGVMNVSECGLKVFAPLFGILDFNFSLNICYNSPVKPFEFYLLKCYLLRDFSILFHSLYSLLVCSGILFLNYLVLVVRMSLGVCFFLNNPTCLHLIINNLWFPVFCNLYHCNAFICVCMCIYMHTYIYVYIYTFSLS